MTPEQAKLKAECLKDFINTAYSKLKSEWVDQAKQRIHQLEVIAKEAKPHEH